MSWSRASVEASHAAVAHAFRRMAELSGGAFVDEPELLRYHCAVGDPVVWNGALVTADGELSAGDAVGRADAFFAPRIAEYGFWIIESRHAGIARYLGDNGVEQIDESPHMVMDLADLQPLQSTVPVTVVTDEPGRKAFVDVAAAGFSTIGANPAAWPVVYPTVESVCTDDVVAVLASVGGQPVGTAMGYLHADVCEVIHVSTLPAVRRQGIGSAVTSGLLAAARERGANMATLQATADGDNVYRSLGFQEIDRYRLYLRVVPPR